MLFRSDIVQTVVRPTAGGLAFGAGSGSKTVTVSDPASFFTSHEWVPVVAGVLIALVVHLTKATARPVVNLSTAGFGAPIVSTIEDFGSVVMSLLAVLLPVLVLVGLLLMAWCAVWVVRRRKRKRAEKQQLSTVETQQIFG